MSILDSIRTVKEMKADGVIEEYALIGTIAAVAYIEPMNTKDVDFMVILPPEDERAPIVGVRMMEFLSRKGFRWKGQAVMIGDWPVDFLPANPGLEREAVLRAIAHDYEGEAVRVARPEHLLAIALSVGRPKDLLKARLLMDQAEMDPDLLNDILARFGLQEAFDDIARA